LKYKGKSRDEDAKFNWSRNHLFDQFACQALYERVEDAGVATIKSVAKKQKLKYRPAPLNTVEA
jgi:DNA topoisomerase III